MTREAQEQVVIFKYAAMLSRKYPKLNLMFHVPNGGSRNKAEAANLKQQGVKAGVPDIVLPVARGLYHGLFIEFKVGTNKLTPEQHDWLEALKAEDYCAVCVNGWENAVKTIEQYISLQDGEALR